MNETKLINFDNINSKPVNSIQLSKQSSPFNRIINEELDIEEDNKSELLSYEESIDCIVSNTSGIIDNTSIANIPQQMLNTSLSHEKLELNSNREALKDYMMLSNSKRELSGNIIKTSDEDLKGKIVGKENMKNSNYDKLSTIDVMNNSAVIDTIDTNTISNEVMSLSSEEETETMLINKASSEISETTLNQSQLSIVVSSNNHDIKGFHLSTGALEITRSVSSIPASPVSPNSPASPSSIINTSNSNQVFVPRSYSALALIDDSNNGSPLRKSFSVFSNYSFSYVNSDDNDSESTLAKKKKSVRFSNIVDVIDSNQRDTMANLDNVYSDSKSEKDTMFIENSTVINIDDTAAEVEDEDMKTITSFSTMNKSVATKVEQFFSVILKYFILVFSNVFCIFKLKKDKEDRKKRTSGYKNQYSIIKDNNLTSIVTGVEPLGDDDALSQSSTIGDSNTQDTISPSSLNCLKELNATNIISSPNKNNENNTVIKPLNQVCVVKDNTDIEFCSINSNEDEYNDSREQLIIETEVIKCKHLKSIPFSSASSFNSVSTSNSISSTMTSVSYPLTINSLSKQKGKRVVRYWYGNNNSNNKKKSIYQKFRLSKTPNNKVCEKNGSDARMPMVSKTIEPSKIKRSSLVNYKPTNIDINNIPNINVTTTANTILNSTSNYRNDRKSNSNLRKEIIIRDLNSNDKVFYSLNLDDSRMNSGLNNTNIISSSLPNKENNDDRDKTDSLDKTMTIKTPLPSSRKFSHRRQNSVRLEISY
ncbi:hypothetical protein BCR36DRAFT_579144 [Piromyces finnis]|uniref:Uncharacterized protein n=1 Tax=Piromyces finnis TaxID=1754191 RepID=A0A1Y1VPM8_9FUNG|nr:hypothetical protein BCR36DRAFT_579144 [Piromyces finnis]|eukprot:ORX61083.1 hypothetical protein BCR36DRAFT_579144 [Piromyces finnis]